MPDEVAAMFDLTQKKKKKKSTKSKTDSAAEGDAVKDSAPESAPSGDVPSSSSANIFELDPPTYSYTQLLNRVVDALQQNNPELTDKKRITMKPPQLMRGELTRIWLLVWNTLFELLFNGCVLLQWVPRRPCGSTSKRSARPWVAVPTTCSSS